MGQTSDGRWEIDNVLLHDLLTYSDGSARVGELKACWSAGHGFYIVKGIVTWLTMRSLKIERLPWMADFSFTTLKYEKRLFVPILKYLQEHPDVVDEASKELLEIYTYTQRFYAGKTYISLGRGYKSSDEVITKNDDYAKAVYRHAAAARLVKKETLEPSDDVFIDVPHDVITSWGKISNYNADYLVGIDMKVAIEDILLSAETIAPRQNEIQHSALESGEFLVLNRSRDGLLKINAQDVTALNGFSIKEPENLYEARKILSEPLPAYRPMDNYNQLVLDKHSSPQSFRSRLSRAWNILTTKKSIVNFICADRTP